MIPANCPRGPTASLKAIGGVHLQLDFGWEAGPLSVPLPRLSHRTGFLEASRADSNSDLFTEARGQIWIDVRGVFKLWYDLAYLAGYMSHSYVGHVPILYPGELSDQGGLCQRQRGSQARNDAKRLDCPKIHKIEWWIRRSLTTIMITIVNNSCKKM